MRMRNKLGLSYAVKAEVPVELADKFLCALANVPHYDHSPDGPNAIRDERGCIHVSPPPGVDDAWQRIHHLFPDLLPKHGNPEHERPCHGVTDGPGFAWQDPDELDFVSVGDIPPKLRIAWTMPSLQGRKMFLLSELAYYLRGPAMMEAALKAREAEMEKRSEAEREGATVEGSFHTSYQVWKDVWQRENQDLAKMWTAADADTFAQVLLRAFEIVDRMRYCPTLGCPAPYFIAQRRSQKYCSDACAVPAQREFKRAWWREHGNHSRRRGTAARQISSRAR
jgi:hypothetical protein